MTGHNYTQKTRKPDSIYTYMDHRTLAGIVAATRRMMDDGNYSNLESGVEAGQVLSEYIGGDAAQALIEAVMREMTR